MCKWGTDIEMPDMLAHQGKRVYRTVAYIDACLAPIVKALNDCGAPTVACCCGHGRGLGNIMLDDGREIFIAPDYDTARATNAAFERAAAERAAAAVAALYDSRWAEV